MTVLIHISSNFLLRLSYSDSVCTVATSLESLVCSLTAQAHSWSQVQRSGNRQFNVAQGYQWNCLQDTDVIVWDLVNESGLYR